MPSADAEDRLTLSASLPAAYPSHSAPAAKLQGPALDAELQAWALQQLAELFTPGITCCPCHIILSAFLPKPISFCYCVVQGRWSCTRGWSGSRIRSTCGKLPTRTQTQRLTLRARSRNSAMDWRLQRQPLQPGMKLLMKKRQPAFRRLRPPRPLLCTESPLWSASLPSRCQSLPQMMEMFRCLAIQTHPMDWDLGALVALVPNVTCLYGAAQAHLAPVTTAQAAADVVTALLQNGKIQRATHNIMAYRISIPGKDAFLQARPVDTLKGPLHHACLHACMMYEACRLSTHALWGHAATLKFSWRNELLGGHGLVCSAGLRR